MRDLAGVAVLALSAAPPFDLQQAHINIVDQRLIDRVMRLQKAHSIAAEVAFEDVDAPELLALFRMIMPQEQNHRLKNRSLTATRPGFLAGAAWQMAKVRARGFLPHSFV